MSEQIPPESFSSKFQSYHKNYREFVNSPTCGILSGVGLTSWLYYNSYQTPRPHTKAGTFSFLTQSMLRGTELLGKNHSGVIDLFRSVSSGSKTEMSRWVKIHFPKELSTYSIAKTVANPSPFPYAGFARPDGFALHRAMFIATAPAEAISGLLAKARYQSPTHIDFLSDMIVTVRRRLYWNAVRGVPCGLLVGSVLPIHPIVGYVSTFNTIFSSFAMLQRFSLDVTSVVEKSSQAPAIHKLMVETNRRTMRTALFRGIPPALLFSTCAAGYFLNKYAVIEDEDSRI